MSLQFILGRLHTKKKDYLYKKMVEWTKEDKDEQVFYLVPDHIKFESEMSILEYIKETEQINNSKYAGMINLQVFSFSRLAWYYLQDTAIFSRSQLTETGLSMLVQKILKEKEEQLSIFRGESHQQGFVEKTTGLFMEMRNGRVTPDDLKQLVDETVEYQTGERNDLEDKLRDIYLLYDEFMYQLQGKYIEREDVIEALIKEVQTRDLSQTSIVIDHFHSFSAQEQALILELVKHAKDVKISLVLNEKYAVEPPELNDLFYEPAMTYYRLYQQALDNQLPVLIDKKITEHSKEYCDELIELENYWVTSHELSSQSAHKQSIDMTKCMSIREAENKQAEILHVATTIKNMVAYDNYRYKDILIVSRVLDDYKTIIESTFDENNIELFIDQADKMSSHSLLEFILGLFQIKKRYWRYNDIMRLLRTELFVPNTQVESVPKEQTKRLAYYNEKNQEWRSHVDTLENVMLAYGYEGSDWVNDENWIYARFHLEEMDDQLDSDKLMEKVANETKNSIRDLLIPFYNRLEKVETNEEAATVLYQFIEKIGVNEQLLYWRDQALEEGDLEDARKHEQVWQTFIQLLDEFVEVLGDEQWDVDSFLTIIETGFEQATYSIVPPSIDQVMFTQFDKSRINTKKVVFILGMTDTQLPMNQENETILTDEDRDRMAHLLPDDKYLLPTTSKLLASEPYSAYLAFMNASEQLIFSYPVKNDGAGDNRISPYIERLSRQLSIPITLEQTEASATNNQSLSNLLTYVGSRMQTIGQLVNVLREGIDNERSPSLFWILLYQGLIKDSDKVEKKILESLDYKNVPKRIPPELAEELYGEDLYLSVSQLESFYLDPFSHFLRYGLKLRERSVQELTPAETGTFFHDALDSIFQSIISNDLSLDTLTDEQLDTTVDDVLTHLYGQSKFRLLSMSNRMKFIRKQLSQTIRQMMWAMTNQAKRSRMNPKKSEVLFGRLGSQQGIPGLSFPLNNGGQLHVRGKIDRLDTIELDNELYLSVVDYKSSSKNLDYNDIYHGLMMQLLTYLDTAVHFSKDIFGKQAKPAGAFYAHVQNPMLDSKKIKGKDHLTEMLKQYKMKGLIVDEEDLLLALDKTLDPGVSSLIYPLKQLVKGDLRGKFIPSDELDLLLKHHREKIRQAGNLILTGENKLSPIYDKKEYTPSVGGEFHPISQFDVLLPDNQNQYRNLTEIKDKNQLIDQLKEDYEMLNPKSEEDNH